MDFDFSHIKLIVGLGNIGDRYARTRHNTGFLFVDRLVEELETRNGNRVTWSEDSKKGVIHTSVPHPKDPSIKLHIIKPTTYMNLSGRAVSAMMSYYQLSLDELLVVHDDLDILLGEYKIQLDKGPKSHNGILSINQHLGTSNYWRIRIGAEYRGESGKDMMSGEAYALEEFCKKEREMLEGVFGEVVQILLD